MTSTFEIKNSRDYFVNLLKAHVDEYFTKENYNSSSKAIICAILAYHQREWFWKDNKEVVKNYLIDNGIVEERHKDNDKYIECKFNEYVNNHCPGFRYIRAICNGSKHLSLRGDISDTEKSKENFNGGFNGQSLATDDLIIIDENNNIIIFKDIITTIISFWNDMFEELEI